MREYIQIVFRLLLPLSGLFMIFVTLYYSQNNNFSEALKLGVLTGFFIAIIVSPFIAFFIYLMRKSKRIKKAVHKNIKSTSIKEKTKTKTKNKKLKTNLSHQETKISSSSKKIILLIDQELTINIMMYAIKKQNIGTVSLTKSKEHSMIKINSRKGPIRFIVSPLTRHTSEITIEAGKDTEYIDHILRYIKEKEYSFLDY